MTSTPPEVLRYRSLPEALAAPDAGERLLLQLPILTPDDFFALAGRAELTPALRARVRRVALGPAPHWGTDPAQLLAAALTAAGTTTEELTALAGEFKVLRTSQLTGLAVTALAAHPACTDDALALAVSEVRFWLPEQTWADTWEAVLVALDAADPAAALAARVAGRDRAFAIQRFLDCLAAARALDDVGRQVALRLLAQTPPLPPVTLLRAASAVAR